jgi:hypothetical protein
VKRPWALALAVVTGCRVPDTKRVSEIDTGIALLGSAVQAGGPPLPPGSPQFELVNQAVRTQQANVDKVSR